MVNMWKKQNINFIEILFDQFPNCWVNPQYADLWEKYFYSKRELIARYNPTYAVQSICGQAIHTLKQDVNDKKASNGYRLMDFLTRYTAGIDYEKCLVPGITVHKTCMEYKTHKLESSREKQDKLVRWFEIFRNNFLLQYSQEFFNKNVDVKFLDLLLIGFIKEAVLYDIRTERP